MELFVMLSGGLEVRVPDENIDVGMKKIRAFYDFRHGPVIVIGVHVSGMDPRMLPTPRTFRSFDRFVFDFWVQRNIIPSKART